MLLPEIVTFVRLLTPLRFNSPPPCAIEVEAATFPEMVTLVRVLEVFA
jgi:hypothetical protein